MRKKKKKMKKKQKKKQKTSAVSSLWLCHVLLASLSPAVLIKVVIKVAPWDVSTLVDGDRRTEKNTGGNSLCSST